jgi:peptidyl-dipeptidase Dcp
MASRSTLAFAVGTILFVGACAPSDSEPSAVGSDDNPLFSESTLLLKMPAFDQIEDQHFAPAFERGMAEQRDEVVAIANRTDEPTLENVIVALERSGQLLTRVSTVFFNLVSTNTNETMEALRADIASELAAHNDEILLNRALFDRIESVYGRRADLGLDPESMRLVERYHIDFVRAGAQLSDEDKERLKTLNGALAELTTTYSQNVLNEVNDRIVAVETQAELAGLSDGEIASAAEAADARGLDGGYVLPLLNTSGQPALASLENRALRQRLHETSLSRGSRGGDFDNREVLTRVVRLRAERAQMLGYPDHATYILEDQTALTPQAVNERLASLAPPAVANARREASDLQALIDSESGDFQLESWDWAYYTEKVRKARFDFDASQLRPYFEMGNVLEQGVFYAANQLYGLTFEERTDLPTYHPDVQVFEVHDADGELLALFLADYYARSSKRGGAWMNAYVSQSNLTGERGVIANHLNVPKPPDGEPTLLTFDEVTTMFHEFGHTLHGMFSNVEYPYFSGTSVPRDFVEFPSQVNEMWATWPEILANYAVHYETGAPMPQELLDKVLETGTFNQGFETTEYLAASLLDQAWHQLAPEEVPSAEGLLDFEADALEKAGVAMDEVPPRYRSTYFSHIMGGYSAGYYSYIWSEVLDADAVEWFLENGGLTRENGDHFREVLLSHGGSEDAMTLYRSFRGADPKVEPLLQRRGLNSN